MFKGNAVMLLLLSCTCVFPYRVFITVISTAQAVCNPIGHKLKKEGCAV
jgi:hypothetical protein